MQLAQDNSARDTSKLEAMVHYIAYKCPDPTKLGATKLNKVFWFADTYAYLQTGKPISGAKYVKHQFGPVPVDIMKVRDSLRDSGAVAITEGLHFGYPQTQFIALKRPDLTRFKAEEISFVDEVLGYICEHHSAKSISDLSHDLIWDAAELGEEIPLYAVFASEKAEITEHDITWAQTQAKLVGLAA